MLVLKEQSKKADINMVYYNVLDTETGRVSVMSITDIVKSNTLGVFDVPVAGSSGIYPKAFVPISDYAWRLFDLIDSPVMTNNANLGTFDNITKSYAISGDNIFINYPMSAHPTDDTGILWYSGSRYFSIFEIYKFIFSLPIRYKPSNNVYLVSSDIYKLDMNEKVIKFMERVAVLC